MEPASGPATAVEPLPGPPRPLGFAAGIGVGVTLAAVAAQAWLAVHLAPLAHLDALGPIANLSALALTPAWRFGVPVATTLGLAALLGLRVRRAGSYAALAALAVGLLILTYVWALAPITDLAGSIRD